MMYYITQYKPEYVRVTHEPVQIEIDWFDLLNDCVDKDVIEDAVKKSIDKINVKGNLISTVTKKVKYLTTNNDLEIKCNEWRTLFDNFYTRYKDLYDADRSSLYTTFYIPKKTGGLREINAPNDRLMMALRELKDILEVNVGLLFHRSAFAYIKNRSTIDALRIHQANNSKWFLKTDFSNFFGSTTKQFLIDQFDKVFPMCVYLTDNERREAFTRVIDLCFLNGGLPQGTPISPFLTNVMMIPIDHEICSKLNKEHFIYTRYADDIQISSRVNFDYKKMVDLINNTLKDFNAPFTIKDEKTRYGSSSGQNWNLGLMLNKDNKITVGYRNIKQFKAMCSNFILDEKNNHPWPYEDVNKFCGLISYYRMIERKYVDDIIKHMSNKYEYDMMTQIKYRLRTGK